MVGLAEHWIVYCTETGLCIWSLTIKPLLFPSEPRLPAARSPPSLHPAGLPFPLATLHKQSSPQLSLPTCRPVSSPSSDPSSSVLVFDLRFGFFLFGASPCSTSRVSWVQDTRPDMLTSPFTSCRAG